MCGIYARMGRRDDELDRRATLSLYHRGPDHVGLLVDPAPGSARHCVALGHTRLSIVDLSPAGHQPMRSADGDVALAYNGEIYNHRELRRELEQGGARFRSDSDTEVLLHLYRAHGDALLDRIEGMYAFVLWDRSARRLLAARDPSGIKPLFFRREGARNATSDALVVGSEIKALLVDPSFARTPDLQALTAYLSQLHTSAPRTAFEGIESLPPGHKLVLRDDAGGRAQVAIERFHHFTLAPKQSFGSLADAADALERLLTRVVDQHMIADVPLGAFLSAGVDSSLLVALMARIKRERGDLTPVQTVTVGFGEEGRQYDESTEAARIARQLGVEHRILRVDAHRIGERVPHVAMQFDEPFGIPTALLHDVLCEAARSEITVALAGDGGDEAFGGYPRHRAARSLSTYTRLLPRGVRETLLPRLAGFIPERTDVNPVLRRARRFLNSAGRDFPIAYREWLSYYTEPELDALLTPESRAASKLPRESLSEAALRDTEEPVGRFDPLDRACLADVYGFLPGVVLQDSDRSSMRVALEVRVPYADRRILDFGLRLPPNLKIPGNLAALVPGGRSTSKAVLRAVAARYLPEKSSNAPKQGFVAPMGTWLNGPLRDLMEEATRPATVEARGVVRPSAVAAMREAHASGSRDRTWQLWALVVMESWFQQRIDELALPDRSGQQVSVVVLTPAA